MKMGTLDALLGQPKSWFNRYRRGNDNFPEKYFSRDEATPDEGELKGRRVFSPHQ
jgi:hypothetical protein